jgi:predicted RNA-binding protein with RPS1 domain
MVQNIGFFNNVALGEIKMLNASRSARLTNAATPTNVTRSKTNSPLVSTMGIAYKKKTNHVMKSKPKKQAKKQKPKHLNRKLGSAATEDERKQILHKIQKLEATKKKSSSSPDNNPAGEIVQSATPVPAGDKVLRTTVSDDAKATVSLDETDKQELVLASEETSARQVEVREKELVKKDSVQLDVGVPNAERDGDPQDAERDDDPPDAERDDDDDVENSKRQRGKRRRGRKDTSLVVEERQKEQETKMDEKTDDEKAPVENAKRYCLGRKPVTDFEVGKSYPGKIVYSKPSLGVFIDIGCHSDAFCHVSRLADDFVADVAQWRAERGGGDTVDAARVVEIDRQRKRITVSLQSEARAEDEMLSLHSRQERRRKLHQKRHGKPKSASDNGPVPAEEKKKTAVPATQSRPQHSKSVQDRTEPKTGTTTFVPANNDAKAKANEEKRQRKLARRAARRTTQETGEQSTGKEEDDV